MQSVTVNLSDETAEQLRQKVNERRDAVERQREQLRRGKRSGSQVEELESHDVSLETAVKASIMYTKDDL